MENKSGLTGWLQSNAWAIVLATASVIISFTLVSGQVKANSEDIADLRETVKIQQNLLERIIVLEEHDKNFTDDLSEIKSDIKDVKRALSLEP